MSERRRGKIDGEILICDSEEAYVNRLAEALLLKKEVTAGVRICTSSEFMEKLLEIGKVQVLLISEDFPYEERRRMFNGRRLVLTRGHCRDLGEEEREVGKYQSVDGLTAEIMTCFQDAFSGMPCAGRGKGRILGVYSPVHRIGKTTLALKLGKLLAEHENVLYLNLEAYAGIGGYFRDGDVQNLSHLLYYAKQDKDDISVRIASMVRQMGNLDYIPPMKVWTDLQAVTSEEWRIFLDRLTSQSIYNTLILDIGNAVEDIFKILGMCDWILYPNAEDVYSKAKTAQYQYMLNVLRQQELEMRTIYINMERTVRQAVKDAADQLNQRTGKGQIYASG